MKILFLTHSFNSLTQRLFVELTKDGYEITIEFDINDATTEEAVRLYQPALIIAPFLKRAIPETVWRNHTCFIVHPGIVGDRGAFRAGLGDYAESSNMGSNHTAGHW